MIYRGQAYGAPVGEWWTSSLHEAEKFAMSRGGNRTYVVLRLDEDDTEWLERFLYFARSNPVNVSGKDRGDWYRIPLSELKKQWLAVCIHSGVIDLGEEV